MMNIKYFEPLKISFGRMKQELFKPFIAKKWFIIGFSAWLANLLNNFIGFRIRVRHPIDIENFNIDTLKNMINSMKDFFLGNIYIAYLIIFGFIFSIALIIIMTWLSSRGKFIFLHNIIERQAEIKTPWERFRQLGNSLFLWRIVFGLIASVSIIILLFPLILFSFKLTKKLTFPYLYFPLIFIYTMLFALFVIVSYLIILYLNDFIVPIMYIYNCGTNKAWKKFLAIFEKEIGCFLLYALYVFLLGICFAVAILAFSICTCCIGLLLLLIPYIGSVILLPVTYTYRCLSIEFLSQFMKDIDQIVHKNSK